MKKIGIITEYNPFHFGHLHHIISARSHAERIFPNEDIAIICVMSGYVTQRGTFPIMSPFIRAKASLQYGVDLVTLLPPIFTATSGSLFAYYALRTLLHFDIDMLVFGSEQLENEKITNYVEFTSMFKQKLHHQSKYHTKTSYLKSQFNEAFQDYFNIQLRPNDTLGLCYIEAFLRCVAEGTLQETLRAEDFFHIVSRTDDNFDAKTLKDVRYASASQIREVLTNETTSFAYLNQLLPISAYPYVDSPTLFNELKIITKKIDILYPSTFELQKYITESSHRSFFLCDSEILIAIQKTKKTSFRHKTKSSIARMFYMLKLGFETTDFEFCHNELNNGSYKPTVLGFSSKGKSLLKKYKSTYKTTLQGTTCIDSYTNLSRLLYLEFLEEHELNEHINRDIQDQKQPIYIHLTKEKPKEY